MARKPAQPKQVEDLKHGEAKRRNIPTAEYQSVQDKAQQAPKVLRYPRNTDRDPQLVWRGKDEQDAQDLVVHAPPIYIQEKVHPKALIDDLQRQTRESQHEAGQITPDLFADFNGIPKGIDKTEFYQHDQNWTNRMILGDSLQVMASLADREGLRGKVQCIYFDPPYGIKFNSNFQWSTTSRDVKDGKADHITREPEQVKAFRDTWRDGIHSYLTYLRDRLMVSRDLLTESGSIFVQIGDENVHRVRALMDEVFGDKNFVANIYFRKTGGHSDDNVGSALDIALWYSRYPRQFKFRKLVKVEDLPPIDEKYYVNLLLADGTRRRMTNEERLRRCALPEGSEVFRYGPITGQGPSDNDKDVMFLGRRFPKKTNRHWSTSNEGMDRTAMSGRLLTIGNDLAFDLRWKEVPKSLGNVWEDTQSGGFGAEKVYVVETTPTVIERCLLMTTDPGDLVLDPTCGSGTTAYVAEQWGRRWITTDTSRVALALARARIMGARYPFYLLADSRDGQLKEAEVTRTAPSTQSSYGNIRHGFVYERVPHVTLKSIANNAEIDVIWENWQQTLEPLRDQLNAALKRSWREWEIPREAEAGWPVEAKKLHADWWRARIGRQKEIDASIAAKAEYENLYDKPYTDNKTVRVAGPFTVESLSPHRMLGVDENDELIDPLKTGLGGARVGASFEQMILENLKVAGVQQAHKGDRIRFTALTGWPGSYICAEGCYQEGEIEKRAGILIGPEFGTVSRPDLVEAAREAGDAGFDVLIACAFNYEAHASEFHKLGRIPVLKARMNADLHMAGDLKATGKGNLFVIFGEPDIEILDPGQSQIRVKVHGVDVFDPSTGEVRSDDTDKIACWFVDTDYNGESFFVRHAYFLGQNDPYKALKITLKAEIDEEAWATLNSDTSRPFQRPKSGRIAVKVINHLGDEVMKVFKV
ncbi:MAG: site-specific DNA-methyltransferase [Pseudomonadota bacterium]|jgi:adenine-specific DNA-methyltransferase|nr:site-specific DNA-methyltransferase [Pseudomonadota bacterium]